jgi:hypothetical protein
MSRDWWVPILQWTFWGIAMSVVMGWMAKSRMKSRPQAQKPMLKHPPSTLVLGLVCTIFFLAVLVISNTFGKNDTVNIWTDLTFLFFAAGGVYMITEYVVVRHRVATEGLHYGPLLTRRFFVSWSDVKSVEYAPTMKWFKLRSSNGKTARVSAMLMGLPEFAQHVLAHVPPGRFDEKTAELLRATAAGNPPSVWN